MRIKICLFLLLCIILSCEKDNVETTTNNQQATLSVPQLTYPQNNSQFVNCTSVTFKWSSVPNAKKYELLISSDSSFQNILTDFVFNNETGLPSFYLQYIFTESISSIIRSTLYWKVKAIDSVGNSSEYSKFFNVNCLSNADVSPLITNTPNDLIIVDPYTFIPTITWAKDPNVLNYEIFGSYSDKFVDKTNNQNFNFSITSQSDIKMTIQTDNFYKCNIFNLRWNDTLQFVVREKFTDGTYSKWSLTNVIIKDPQINLYTGDYQVKMKKWGDSTTFTEVIKVSKYSETYISLSIPSKGRNLGYYGANNSFIVFIPNRLGEFSAMDIKPTTVYFYNIYCKSDNGKMSIKGNGYDFEILSGYKL